MSTVKIVKLDPLHIKQEPIKEAAKILKNGGLVIIPTETVYGIAANMLDEKAVQRLSEIKGRAKDKPFSLHIAKKDDVEDFAQKIPLSGYKLMERFWPGPLTLVFSSIREGKIGMRMPDNEIALEVIREAAVPIICPSANLSGNSAPVNFQQAIKDLRGKVDFAIDAGAVKLGIESTVVDLTVEPLKILRTGAIKQEDIEKVVKTKQVLFICTGNSCRSVMAEALLKKILKERNRSDIEVSSAGLMLLAGLGVSGGTREVLSREGIDVSTHYSQRVTKEMIKKSDFILVMEKVHQEGILKIAPEVKNRVFLLKEFAKINDNNLDIADPISKPLEFYEKTFATIKEAVEKVSNLL